MTEHTVDLTRQLSEWLDGSDITLLELSGPGKLIRLRRNGGVHEAVAAQPDAEVRAVEAPKRAVVRAGSVGIALHAHPLREDPLVRVGDSVVTGQTVAILKIGAVLLAVPSPRAGVVTRIAAANNAPVGWGEPLVEIE